MIAESSVDAVQCFFEDGSGIPERFGDRELAAKLNAKPALVAV